MYPLLCPGGYGMPIRAGKNEIVHITANAYSDTDDMYIRLVDDISLEPTDRWGKLPAEKTRIQRQITTTDNQIDKLTYDLYGLTQQEIKIIEEANDETV